MNSYARLYLWLVAHRRAVLLTAVLVAAISYAGYIAVRIVGERKGLLTAGLLGAAQVQLP